MKKRLFFKNGEKKTVDSVSWLSREVVYVQQYSGAWKLMARVKRKSSLDFLFWAIEKMDSENRFSYTAKVFSDFNMDMEKEAPGTAYKKNTVDVALSELCESGLVERLSRGHYRVNPQVYWSSSRKDRDKVLSCANKEAKEKETYLEEAVTENEDGKTDAQ